MRRRFKKRYAALAVVIALFLLINAPGLFAVGYRWWYAPRVASFPELRLGQERLLVLSPHPDDESLCCAGAIQQVLEAGGQVFILWLTSGDGFEWDTVLVEHTARPRGAAAVELGNRRMEEARAAARALGVPPEHLFFLGYPDRGLQRLLADHRTTPYRSPLSGADAVPYQGTVSPGAPYTGENLERDFRRVLEEVRPTLVLAPSLRDAHPDHHATAGLALGVWGEGETPRVRFWIIHGGLEWPLPKGLHTNLPLEPAPRGRGLSWERLNLSPTQQRVKLEALEAHHTQMELLSRFMLAFVRQNELYSPLPVP